MNPLVHWSCGHPKKRTPKLQAIINWHCGLNEMQTKFWEISPGKFDLFFWYFFFLENLMCSNEILDKISWKNLICFYVIFSPGKSYAFLQNSEKALQEILMCSSIIFFYQVLLENLMCSYKVICPLLENSYFFLLHRSLLERKLLIMENVWQNIIMGKNESFPIWRGKNLLKW